MKLCASRHELNPAHADYAALPQDLKNLVQGRIQFLGGNGVALRFKPYLEVFHLSKLLVPGVQIQIKMYFNPPAMWTVRWDGASTLRLTEADVSVRLNLCKVRVTPSVYIGLMTELRNEKKKVATYPTVRGEIRTYSHPNDNQHFECNNPFHNQLPNQLIVVLMEQAVFNGSIVHSPFNFGKFNLATIKQLVRGEEYPYETLELQHDGASKDQRGYYRFLQASGTL